MVYMMADTFRRDHMGAYGNRWIRTPNLDRLAAQSARFENAYIGSFPTVPNRRDTLLGRGDLGLPFNRWKPLERQEVTLPQRLAEKKIPSMWIGDTQNNVTRGINMNKGFSAWALNRGQEADPCWLDANVPLEFPVPPHLIRYRPEVWHRVLINRAHRRVETDWFAPGTYTMAIRWLERNYKRPDFFLWVDTFDPHEPWDPPQHYTDLYHRGFKGRVFDAPTYGLRRKMGITAAELRNIRARYAGEVTMVDTWAGQLLATLERLGILDETTVVFTSDHGTLLDGPGDNGLICKPNTVGADGVCMSGGRPMKEPCRYFPILCNVARVPLLVRPAGMASGKTIRAIVQPWDMTATILETFGMAKPPELIGESLLPLIAGTRKAIRDVAICGTNALAQAMTGRWVYTVWRGLRPPSLIDLRSDAQARRNVLARHPAVVRRLHRRIVDFMRAQEIDDDLVAQYR
jgi:arylsulfatase A-like enzyme